MQTIGERLEEARKKKGISIREAAEATKIRGDYLQKFEGNHFDIGISEIYTRGFLRNYANYLKVPADRLLNDYAALGRGEPRPRQPSREVYGRMDITVASANEKTDRAAPPEEGAAAAAEPARAQPRYPRGGNNLPSGPDPAVIFRYAKWAGIGVVSLLAIWLVVSLVSNRSAKNAQASSLPAAATQTATTQPPAANRVVIIALDVVRVNAWAKDSSAPNGRGAEVLAPVTLRKGETTTFSKNGPVFISASAVENIQVKFDGNTLTPSAPPNNFRGAMEFILE